MKLSKEMTLLSPEYEKEYEAIYNKQPNYIPVDIKPNFGLPDGIEVKREYSRVWVRNAKAKSI